MVTYEQLREHIGRRPFRPFRVVLNDGKSVDVVRVAQAVAMKHRLVVGVEERWLRIWLRDIDHVEVSDYKAA